MFREILVAQGNSLTLDLPDELVGKPIEVLAFALPIDKPNMAKEISEEEMARRVAEIRAIFAGVGVDLSNYRFDREEANNYDDE